MVLIIDNYDSFTYNLLQRLGEQGAEVNVLRNDKTDIHHIESMSPDHIIISPGPCTPLESGISNEVVSCFAGKVPILGVCLGHQCIAYTFGALITRHRRLMHGKTSEIEHDGKGVFEGLPNPFTATRYHSLSVEEDTLPDFLEVTARAEPDEIMGIRHTTFPVEGVQFHPESFLTDMGPQLLKNFLKMG